MSASSGELCKSERPTYAGKTTKVHRLVYANEVDKLRDYLLQEQKTGKKEKESAALRKRAARKVNERDGRGNLPLGIAAALGSEAMIRLLLEMGAEMSLESDEGWTPFQEAAAAGRRDLMGLLYRESMLSKRRLIEERAKVAAEKLAALDDFYLEIEWRFSSWVPFIAHFFPSDCYRLWKVDSAVRVDTSVVGFENRSFVKGHNSLMFTGADHAEPFRCLVLNRVGKTVADVHDTLDPDDEVAQRVACDALLSGKRSLSSRRNTGVVEFRPLKGGFFGGGTQKSERIADRWEALFYEAIGVELTHVKRREQAVRDTGEPRTDKSLDDLVSAGEYFGERMPYQRGRGLLWPQESRLESNRSFTPHVGLSQDYPLTLGQLMPLFESMTSLSEQFERLREFVELDLPDGFPVRLQLPGIYHIITASIEFTKFRYIGKSVAKNAELEQVDDVDIDAKDAQGSLERVFDIPKEFTRKTTSMLVDAIQEGLEFQEQVKSSNLDND
jgi:ankyrin repeat domain-containing protein 13